MSKCVLIIYPVLPFLVFLEFLGFFLLRGFSSFFLSVFPFLSRDFKGSVGIKNPCFIGGFPWRSPKKQGKEGQGNYASQGLLEKHTPPCSSEELSLPPKNGVH